MKIAIQGHPTRGKEVIQILESLGGINDGLHEGNNPDCYYELHDNIIWCVSTKGINFKYYTLEEFEKEFPFKIGDEVITPLGHIGTIISIKDNKYEVFFKIDSALISPKRLKLYKEMKEERNITLTLEKAKEWYKKGGELREIALQAFSKKELSPLPRNWEEFSYKYNICSTRYAMPSKYEALYQLEQLKNCWWNGWEPDWTDNRQTKYCVLCYNKEFKINTFFGTKHFLAFPTKEMAEEFLECFRDLIEKAGDLI